MNAAATAAAAATIAATQNSKSGAGAQTEQGEFPDCGCHYTIDDDGIHFCAMHKAAPLLLEACKEIVAALEGRVHSNRAVAAVHQAREAISRATERPAAK